MDTDEKSLLQILDMAYEITVHTVKARPCIEKITDKDCPYGYSFCYERKRAKDRRYIQEWTCNWFMMILDGENEHPSCQEVEAVGTPE